MPFKVIDNKLLKKSNKVWEIVINLMKIKFNSEPFYDDNDQYIRQK